MVLAAAQNNEERVKERTEVVDEVEEDTSPTETNPFFLDSSMEKEGYQIVATAVNSVTPSMLRNTFLGEPSPLREQAQSGGTYKVHVEVGTDPNRMGVKILTADTAAGVCLVDRSEIPPPSKHLIEPCGDVIIKSATNHEVLVEEMIKLTLRIGDLTVDYYFGIVDDLPPKLLVGTSFINKYIQSIKPLKRKIYPIHSRPVPLIACKTEDKTFGINTIHTPTAPTWTEETEIHVPLRVARQCVIPANCQKLVTVYANADGLLSVQSESKLFRTRQCQVANGIAEVEAGEPFQIWVANFSKAPKHIPKRMCIGILTNPPEVIYHQVAESDETDPTQSEVYSMITKKPFDGAAIQHREVLQKDKNNADANWKESVVVGERYEKYREALMEKLDKYEAMWDGHLGMIKATQHYIEITPESRPSFRPPYRASPAQRELEKQEIQKMLEANVIEPSTSEWAAPIVFAPKKDGTLRFCVDYRKLNALTVRDSYPIPRMDECIDSLGDAEIFTSLDANSGYWQIEMDAATKDRSAFVSHHGMYQFVRMPFGLRNAPATFQRAIDFILADAKWQFAIVYIDDIIIFSRTPEEHLEHLDTVLGLLAKAGVTLKLNKCHFFREQIEYLGHIIAPGELRVANKTTENVKLLDPPTTKTEVRSFLGMCNVYRRFIKDFATIARPLTSLTKKEVAERWQVLTEEQMHSFETLKEKLVSPPVLALPRPDLPYIVETDANDYQVGCVLSQKYPDGTVKPLGYFSKTLSDTERKYDTSERECLGIIWATLLLRPYLQPQRFTLKTDHEALKWLFKQEEATGKLARWRLRLQEFEFDVIHVPGKKNQVADALSRLNSQGGDKSGIPVDVDVPVFSIEDDINPLVESADEIGLESDADLKDVDVVEPITEEELIEAQKADKECQQFANSVGIASQFDFDNRGILVRKAEIDGALQKVIPRKLRERVIALSHKPITQGHPGETRLYNTMRHSYYWPFMSGDLAEHVKTCRSCVMARGLLHKKQHKTKVFPPSGPLDDIAMDLLGPLPQTRNGNQFILVITDRYSKLARAIPMNKTTAPFVAAAVLNNWIFCYGIPNTILTDNGTQFISEFFKTVCHIMGIRRKTTTAYHPQTNGQAERYNKTLATRLRHYVADHQRDWDKFVQPLTYAYNNQIHTTTMTTPFNLTITRPPPSPIIDQISTAAPTDTDGPPSSRTMRARILNRLSVMFDKADSRSALARALYKRYADRTIRHTPVFKRGDRVFLSRPPTAAKTAEEKENDTAHSKLRPKMIGPYDVLDANAETVKIEQDGLEVTVTIDRCVLDPGQTEEDALPAGNAQTRPSHPESQIDTQAPNQTIPAEPVATNADARKEISRETQPDLMQPDDQTPIEERNANVQVSDQTEKVVTFDPDPPQVIPQATAEQITDITSHRTAADGSIRYAVRYNDQSQAMGLTANDIPVPVIDAYYRGITALRTPHPTVRRRGRPRGPHYQSYHQRTPRNQPLIPSIASSAQPPPALLRYATRSSQPQSETPQGGGDNSQ